MVSIRACRVRDLGSNPSRGAVIFMVVTLKLNKGTVEKLLEIKDIKADQARNLSEGEVTIELNDNDVLIEIHEKEKMIEIADYNGSFGIWFKITNEKIQKLKELAKMGP